MAHAAVAEHGGGHATSTGTDNRKLLMWIFLGSECLFFGSLIATYMIFKNDVIAHGATLLREAIRSGADLSAACHAVGNAAEAVYMNCHDLGVGPFPLDTEIEGVHFHGILDIPITSTSTFVLLMSSVTMVLAVYGAQNALPKMMKLSILATILLGIVFLGFQVYEFRTFGAEGLNLTTNLFGASFFVLTGFHGTHVGVGVLYLACLLFASFRRTGLGADTGFHVETAGLYWHFVDIVWIVIFTIIYLLP